MLFNVQWGKGLLKMGYLIGFQLELDGSQLE